MIGNMDCKYVVLQKMLLTYKTIPVMDIIMFSNNVFNVMECRHGCRFTVKLL